MKFRKILSGFIATALSLSVLPGSVLAASGSITIDVNSVVKDTVDIGVSTDYCCYRASFNCIRDYYFAGDGIVVTADSDFPVIDVISDIAVGSVRIWGLAGGKYRQQTDD